MYTQTFYFTLGKDSYGLDEVQTVAGTAAGRSG